MSMFAAPVAAVLKALVVGIVVGMHRVHLAGSEAQRVVGWSDTVGIPVVAEVGTSPLVVVVGS